MTRRAAILVSGTGRHLEHIGRLCQAGELDLEVGLCLSNKPGVLALERAEALGIPQLVLDPERNLNDAGFSHAAFTAIQDAGCDLILLAGFLRMLVVPRAWNGRVLNIHPSLLPAFGGKGCWGHHVHQAVLDRGCQVTGCTVHVVDNQYDHGPIVLQRTCPVEPNDTVDTLAARVFEVERDAYPDAIRQYLADA